MPKIRGYFRFLVDDSGSRLRRHGTARLAAVQASWNPIGHHETEGRSGKAGAPVGDDLVERESTAAGSNWLWLTDITQHGAQASKRGAHCSRGRRKTTDVARSLGHAR